MTATVLSVNAGSIVPVPWGREKRSAIDKCPIAGPVRVETLGLVPDEIADLKHHGGVDQAVYAFAEEDLATWRERTGKPFPPGTFGENLTTVGLDVTASCICDRWRIGSVLLEVADVRIPCSVFQGFVEERQWMRRFTEDARPGAYLRVLEEGELAAGDVVEVVETRPHELTVGYAFRAQTTERELLPALLDEPRASAKILQRAHELTRR